MTMQVRSLQSQEEFHRYAAFSQDVYQQNPYWVPPDLHHLTGLLSGELPFGSHAHIQPFWIEEGGRILATVTAVIDDLFNQHWKEPMGHLVSFEALSGQAQPARVLLQTACQWLQEQRCKAARLSFHFAWQLPLTIDAYESVPTFFHSYNPPYYHSYIKDAGFVTENGLVQYQVQFTGELAKRYQEMIEFAARTGVELRSWNFDKLDEEVKVFTENHNETFAEHWGAAQFTLSEMQNAFRGLKDLLVADFCGVAEVDGRTAGVVFCLPDLNQAFHRMRGKNIEEHLPELSEALQKIDHGILLSIGVRSQFRGRGINLGLAAKSYLAMMDRGYKTASYTVVLDTNWRSRRTAERLGGRITRNFVVYRKELG
jgi:GNAT superfamily N-acetyltransferase